MDDLIAKHIESLDRIIESLQRERINLSSKLVGSLVDSETAIKIAHAVIKDNRRKVSAQAKDWAGYAVSDAIGFSVTTSAGRSEMTSMLSAVCAMGLLSVGYERDTQKGRNSLVYVPA
jgi:hypothetical protein